MPTDKVPLDIREITARIKQIALPEVDWIVAVGRGGLFPGTLLAFHLDLPLGVVGMNYRHDDNRPRYETPQVLTEKRLPTAPCRVLLVDDVSVSGKTLEAACHLLQQHHITTFVLKGHADIVVFPEIGECVDWPWNLTG
ncbi:MAG: phosphoribosyltransferase [Anaerolineae bacterium]|nr:phosphoribosyltransferase [Anaerolineae bacterium]